MNYENENQKASRTPTVDLEFQDLEKEFAELREIINVLEARLSFVTRESDKPQLEINVRANIPTMGGSVGGEKRDPISPLVNRIRQNSYQVANIRAQILSILNRLDL